MANPQQIYTNIKKYIVDVTKRSQQQKINQAREIAFERRSKISSTRAVNQTMTSPTVQQQTPIVVVPTNTPMRSSVGKFITPTKPSTFYKDNMARARFGSSRVSISPTPQKVKREEKLRQEIAYERQLIAAAEQKEKDLEIRNKIGI